MARQAKPNDYTGRQREALSEQFIDEQQTRANEMSMATAQAQIKLETEVLDATIPNRPVTVVVDEATDLTKNGEESVVIRTIDTIESMTCPIMRQSSWIINSEELSSKGSPDSCNLRS